MGLPMFTKPGTPELIINIVKALLVNILILMLNGVEFERMEFFRGMQRDALPHVFCTSLL